jgi:putative FmdB family regulatory protein
MPIYAYRCSNCGHAQDVLQRISDPLLTVCPVCGQSTYVKQVTAAGFQLKGSGWYVTDFRGDNKTAKPVEGGAPAKPGDKGDDKSGAPVDSKSETKSETKGGDGGKAESPANAAPAASSPAPSAAPAAAPSPSSPGKTGS